jgi:HAD superfamily phosphoserine phosphatase-like hydrolase
VIPLPPARPRFASVIFDVDSTVAAIEGVDWLAERRGAAIARECVALTARAMSGEVPLEAVYQQRLAAIAPRRADIDALARAYLDALQPGAPEIVMALRDAGVDVHLVSGGLREAIVPLAIELGVSLRNLHAVELLEDHDGLMTTLHGEQPLATQRGKPLVLSQLALPRPTAMIGDGSTDAAARGVVDRFFAFTGIARRDAVVAVADAEARDFLSLLPLLFEIST